MFDKIIIDKRAAEETLDYLDAKPNKIRFEDKMSGFCPCALPRNYETEFLRIMNQYIVDSIPRIKKVAILRELLNSELFEKIDVAGLLTEQDFQSIADIYYRNIGLVKNTPKDEHYKQFQESLKYMINKYGTNYAKPSPKYFEAMNLGLTRVISNKLNACPIDDICRLPLYELEAMEEFSTSNSTINEIKHAYDIIDQARQVLYLPAEPIKNAKEFLALYKDKRIVDFREKVKELSLVNANHVAVKKAIKEAEDNLRELSIKRYSISIGFFGIATAALGGLMTGNFVSGTLGSFPGLITIGNELMKVRKRQRFIWLDFIRGFVEK